HTDRGSWTGHYQGCRWLNGRCTGRDKGRNPRCVESGPGRRRGPAGRIEQLAGVLDEDPLDHLREAGSLDRFGEEAVHAGRYQGTAGLVGGVRGEATIRTCRRGRI